MITDWHQLRAHGADARMYATENAVVDQLNTLARHTLRAAGQLPRKGRWYTADDGESIEYAVGDRIRLGANLYRLPQPDGTTATLRNAAYGTVSHTKRHSLTLRLDPDHRDPDGPAEITLPADYIAARTRHGYAATADSNQGATVDHALFAPSPAATAERGYVALSRGRHTNRIYATHDSGWQDAIAHHHPHTLALHQHPDPATPRLRTVTGKHRGDADAARPEIAM